MLNQQASYAALGNQYDQRAGLPTPIAPADPGALTAAFKEQDFVIAEVIAAIKTPSDRLGPVLRPEPPAGAGSESHAPRPDVSQATVVMATHNQQLRIGLHLLRSMTERVDL